MPTGNVKWFDEERGFGFISQADQNEDLFVHHSAIKMQGFRKLTEGQKVIFEIVPGKKGLQAADVEVLD